MASKLFTFNISLSVLDHLGRNLYRNFATVLGEAISNSWDANAENVWIYVDKEKNSFIIKDDGDGMTADDFQNKFLKIGYSKRQKGETESPGKRRPYIGRKGIGKLALLSCAKKITVISRIKDGEYVGGLIDNSGLDRAITEDLTPSEYPLEKPDLNIFEKYKKDHKKGTIIYFEDIKEGMKNSLDFLRKIIALYFRFSLLDSSFNIFLDDKKITLDDVKELIEKTQFLWNVNSLTDPYIQMLATNIKKQKTVNANANIKGFIASVIKPKDLNILSTGERAGIDLFVNGRLRERDILKHIPTARVVEEYLYGQIHFDSLDGKNEKDRFATSREGIIADDEKYNKFLDDLKNILSIVLNDWDIWRRESREFGDPENMSISPRERRAEELFNEVSKDYNLSEESEKSKGPNKKKIDEWVDELGNDAKHNFTSYAECFISENLVRKHIQEKNVQMSPEAKEEIKKRKDNEIQHKNAGNINIEIRRASNDTSYLAMDHLANLVDKSKDVNKEPGISRDAKEYKPIRDALMHTALLTTEAKDKLVTVKSNIKGRVKDLLSEEENTEKP